MYSIDSQKKHQPSYFDDVSSGGGNVLPSNSTKEAFISLCATINFIDFWPKCLEYNYLERSNMSFETMKCMFQKISYELPKALSNKEKR